MLGRAAWVALTFAACGGSQEPAPAAPPEAPAAAAPEQPEQPEQSQEPTLDALRIAAIEKAVNDNQAAQHRCWERAAANNYRVSGTVVLAIEFASATAAGQVAVLSDQTNEPALGQCLVELYQNYEWPAVWEPGIGIELPFAFAPATAQFTVHRDYVPVHGEGSVRVQVLLDAKSTGNQAASLSVLTLAPKAVVPLQLHDAATVWYLESGSGVVYGARGKRAGRKVSAGDAIYIAAGVAAGFEVTKGPVTAVQVYAPGGPEQRYEDPKEARGTTEVSVEQARKLAREGVGGPMVITHAKAPVYPLAGGQASVRQFFDAASAGDDRIAAGQLQAIADMAIAPHTHPSTELLFVREGGGTMTIDGEAYPVTADMAIQIPAGIEHSFTAGSSGVMALQFYTPAGPEQRFKPPSP